MTEKNTPILSPEYLDFRNEITSRIRSPQYEALKAVNKEMIALYWEIGRRITEQQGGLGLGKIRHGEPFAVHNKRMFLGIKGFGVSNMWDMARFYTEYRSNEILQPLVGEISWSKHIVILTKCKEMQQRQFYILSTKKYGWTKDVLINKDRSKDLRKLSARSEGNFDMTLPEKIKNQAILALKDEYTFDLVGLSKEHSEYELEQAIIKNIRAFLME